MPQRIQGINDKVAPFVDDLGRRQRWWRAEARKKGVRPSDLAKEVDLRSAEELRQGLRMFFPDDTIMGEELPPENEGQGRTWVLDPLDGSRNYSHGLALWGISVALVVEGRPVAGVYHLPDVQETFIATRNAGAKFNGDTLMTPRWDGLTGGDMVAVGGWDVPTALRRGAMRRLGCAGAELCYLAAGRLAAVALASPRLWDVAAAALIAEEAGAEVGFVDGQEPNCLWPWAPAAPKRLRTMVAWAPGVEDPREGAPSGKPTP